ncbi:hypothetical protein A2704_05065 [Candidatus Kaiserbacteria bacterium RIFCSPHIGHO2_01_FULL_54_36b]|uniref:Surface carbohydrate biosynthesis protein n=1 Tax=Candidatus Kaiserbacteria bacterium RIFCSPHIGHO2_01_FULL_54_36b TaxID=1798483 RepID=A0A1F6CN24_9BACT|nr:MAG: hypothetical protein A2704_05065 [Candidatus Kaiserbacteria bacterium RIFCSPHIGHO2_01_FULL_54_36b]
MTHFQKTAIIPRVISRILYLPIETIARELDANLLIAHEALKRGYIIVLGEKREVQRYARELGGGVYIYKHWEALFPYRFGDERRKHFFYAGSHQEGVVYIDDTFFLRRGIEQNKTHLLDVYFARGKAQEALLKRAYPLLESVVEVTGSPSFDILRDQYRTIFQERCELLSRTWSPFILVNTNFTAGNKTPHEVEDVLVEREKSSVKNLGRSLTENEKSFFLGLATYKERLFQEYVAMVRALSVRFSDTNIIVRPHPSENHLNWRRELHGLKNVRVIYSGNVIDWILASKAVIHTGCTTGIEAWAVGKPVLRYNPLGKSSEYESELPNKFGRYFATIPELEVAIKNIGADNKSTDSFVMQGDFLKPYMDSVSGELATVRELDSIERRGDIGPKLVYEDIVRNYRTFVRSLRIIIKRLAYALFRHPSITRFLLGRHEAALRASRLQKFPYLSRRYISRMLRKFEMIDSMKPRGLRFVRIDVNTYIMTVTDTV